MIDLGRKIEHPKEVAPSGEKEISYPSLYIEKDLGFGEEDVGKEMTAVIKIKLTSFNKRIDEKKKEEECRFDILAIEINKKPDDNENVNIVKKALAMAKRKAEK